MIRAPSGISAIAESRELTIFGFIFRPERIKISFPVDCSRPAAKPQPQQNTWRMQHCLSTAFLHRQNRNPRLVTNRPAERLFRDVPVRSQEITPLVTISSSEGVAIHCAKNSTLCSTANG